MNFFRKFIKDVANSDGDLPPVDPSTLTDADFDEVITLLSEPEYVFAAEDLIRRAGAHAEPALLRAMNSGVLVSEDGDDAYRSPFQIVGSALVELGSRDWAGAVRPYVRDPGDPGRTARLFLGHTADATDLPLMRELLALPEVDRSRPGHDLLAGLNQRLRSNPNDAALVRELADDLWRYSLADSLRSSAPRLLLQVDQYRTTERVRQELLNSRTRQDWPIDVLVNWIKALIAAHVRLEPSEADDLLRWGLALTKKARKHDFRAKRVYGETLMLSALAKTPAARQAIEAALTTDDPIARNGLRALAFWHDIDLWSPRNDWPDTEPPTPVLHYRAICALDGQIGNGGISQYFGNSYGDHARLAAEALAAIGDVTGRTILLDAMKAFGPNGPSPDRVERNQQLDAMLPEGDEDELATDPLAGIDDRWYDHSQTTWRLLLDYMIVHRKYFAFE